MKDYLAFNEPGLRQLEEEELRNIRGGGFWHYAIEVGKMIFGNALWDVSKNLAKAYPEGSRHWRRDKRRFVCGHYSNRARY